MHKAKAAMTVMAEAAAAMEHAAAIAEKAARAFKDSHCDQFDTSIVCLRKVAEVPLHRCFHRSECSSDVRWTEALHVS